MPASDLVYRQYDRSALDAEYDNVRKHPGFDFPAYLQRLSVLNQQACREYRRSLLQDLAYGSGPDEVLDLFRPNPGGPLHVFFHGGYWRMLHKNDFSYVALGVLPHKVNLAVVNYSLMPAVSMETLVGQCRRAIQYLFKHSAELDIDPEQVSVSGHSAGGHLAAMMAATAFASSDARQDLTHVCALSGIFDLEPIQRCFLNDTLGLSESDVSLFSPVKLKRVHQGSMVLMTGAEEGDEYARQAETLARAWSQPGSGPMVMLPRGHDHFSLREALSEPDSEVTRAILGHTH